MLRNAFKLTNSNTQSQKTSPNTTQLLNHQCNLPPHWQCGANRVRVRLAGVTKCDKCGTQNDVTTPLQLSLKCLRDECCCSRFCVTMPQRRNFSVRCDDFVAAGAHARAFAGDLADLAGKTSHATSPRKLCALRAKP